MNINRLCKAIEQILAQRQGQKVVVKAVNKK